VTMDIYRIRDDQYVVVLEWRKGKDTGYTLDDSLFAQVNRYWDEQANEFYIFCHLDRSETCNCAKAVKQQRKDCFLDPDTKE
jgi:hypothetical protein